MKTSTTTRKDLFAAAWTAAWGLQLLGGGLTPVWAQRRRAEPSANPQFQQQLSGNRAGGGGPISGAPAGGAPAGVLRSATPQASPGAGPARGAGTNVRVGASAPRRAAPPPPSNPLETRIVVRVKNAPLSTFLDTISAQAKVNFIITEGLEEKRVTAFLQNVTVREALQILLEIKGLTYQRIGKSNTYVVSPRAAGVVNRITRIYQLNYIPLIALEGFKATGKQESAQVQSGGGAPSPAGAPSGPAGAPPGPGGPQASAGSEEKAQIRTDIPIVGVLYSVLTTHGKISLDPRTNSIIITDVPEVFPQIEQILAELDRKSPQVMIEAQIVEINSDRANQMGLEWGGANGELATFTGGMRDTTFPLSMESPLSKAKFFDPTVGVLSRIKESGGDDQDLQGFWARAGLVDMTSLTIVLRAMVSRAEARFLGKPKVLTMNNTPATISILRTEALALTTQSSQDAGGSSSGTEPERNQTGLHLRVTPQVNQEGYITLDVQPFYSNAIESKISTPNQRIFDPLTRSSKSLVRVKNGQTLVLGGLLESRESKSVRKVPFLGYIPLIGWLFTSVSNQRVNTDLVIFVTPTIVHD